MKRGPMTSNCLQRLPMQRWPVQRIVVTSLSRIYELKICDQAAKLAPLTLLNTGSKR